MTNSLDDFFNQSNQGLWVTDPTRTTFFDNRHLYSDGNIFSKTYLLMIDIKDFIYNNIDKQINFKQLCYIKSLLESADEYNYNLAYELFKIVQNELDRTEG